MDATTQEQQKQQQQKCCKFLVYQNPTLSAALTSTSLRPNPSTFISILSLSSISFLALLFITNFPNASVLYTKLLQTSATLVFLSTLIALLKAISQWRGKNVLDATHLTNRQLRLLGFKPKENNVFDLKENKPLKTKTNDLLFPLHQSFTNSNSNRMSSGKPISNRLNNSPVSPSVYLVPTRSPYSLTSVTDDQCIATPWSNKRTTFRKEAASEEEFEKFLADVDDKISETVKMATPTSSINVFGVGSSPNTVNTSGTRRSTPLRTVRMSPGSQKFTTPPKKGEADLPTPMSVEESREAFGRLGIYPCIEQWRDRLRQWFSETVLNSLLSKIETSHLKVMEAATKLNTTITISQVGSDASVDEDGLLHQLRANLVQVLDACTTKPTSNFQQAPQNAALIPVIQECIDAITEHQRLNAMMKGEWGKGLLSISSFPAKYTVERIRYLAEGTCVKNYEHLEIGEVNGKANRKWSLELPSDSHLLLYLFCAFLEHPKWMLHVDPTVHAGAHSSKNPLFLGVLPSKETFPEKYLGVLGGVPSVLHPGACILAVGKQSPPVLALYWDKKPQFSLQGRTALWDSVLLFCNKIKCSYDGVVRGMHLGSSALNILPVLDQEPDD